MADSAGDRDYAGAFRDLYHHLYTNSGASRAERIIADLTNLLLAKLGAERNGEAGGDRIARFVAGAGTASDLLAPLLTAASPRVLTAGDGFHLEDRALRRGLAALAPLALRDAPAHALGEAFQALMGPRLRGEKGQFFTPRTLARAMITILDPRPDERVVDPACGTGGFLIETRAAWAEEGVRAGGQGIALVGVEKDYDLARLAEAALAILAPERGAVHHANALDLAGLAALPPDGSPLGADVVLTNPPFGARIKVTEAAILRQFALGHRWVRTLSGWRQTATTLGAQDPQILFIELGIRLLRPGGRMGIVLPEGVFGNQSLGYVLDYIRSQGHIFALLDCPRTTFQPGTDTKTNVLFFRKGSTEGREHREIHTEDTKDTEGRREREKGRTTGATESTERRAEASPPVPLSRGEGSQMGSVPARGLWTAVAAHCGHDRRGRPVTAGGAPYPDDLVAIGQRFAGREAGGGPWQAVAAPEPYYLVPRYYDRAPLRELEAAARRMDATLTTIGQLVRDGHLRIRKGHEVGAEAYGTGDIPFVRTSDIANFEVSIDPTRSVSEEVYRRYADQQCLNPRDLLLVCDGRYRIGRAAILLEHNARCVVQSHIRILTLGPSGPVDAFELLYLLNLPMVRHHIRDLVFVQSTLGQLGKRLLEVTLPLPARTAEWERTAGDFKALITERARMLRRLREFEPPGDEL